MAAEAVIPPRPALGARRAWLAATLAGTLLPIGVAALCAPPSGTPPARGLVWLLFVGSSVHVASTAWFATVPEVRAHMRQHTARYMWVPAALVVGTAAVAAVLTARSMTWLLLGFFGWQFFHFQKQNLGIAALAARAHHARSLSQVERRALVGAGIGGVAGLVGHAHLLQVPYAPNSDLLFAAGGVCFALSVALGLAAAARRPRAHRPTEFIAVYAVSLLFFGPVWLFASPYAAVAGLTIAHGVQYLLLMGLLAAADRPGRPRALGLLVLLNLALVAGVALNALSHLHGNSLLQRLLFGAYLGLVMTHFVVDAGLWRLRDQFPRAFLRQRLPFLLDV